MTNAPLPILNKDYEFSLENWRERFVRNVLIGSAIFGALALIPSITASGTNLIYRMVYGGAYLVLLLITLLRLPTWLKTGVFLFLLYALGFSGLLETGIWADSRLFFLGFVVMASMLFSPRAGIVALAISLISTAIIGFLVLTGRYQITSNEVISAPLENWISGGMSVLLLGTVAIAAQAMFQNEFQRAYERGRAMLAELSASQRTLEERVAERTTSLEKRTAELSAASSVAQKIAATKEIGSLLPGVVDAITDRYGFYHASIYLMDEEGKYGYLQAASSQGGKLMLARGHQFEMSGEGFIEKCAAQKRYQLAQDIAAESAELENPDLPFTRSRAAFPLLSRGRVIGVLDIHSKQPNSFQPSELEAIQIISDQLSLAIENARLFADMQAIIEQMQRADDYRAYLAWKELTTRQAPAYQYTPLGVQLIGSAPEPRQDAGNLVVPITLRGQTIGRIQLKRKGTASGWVAQEQLMIQKVASQVALALENARLLEDAQTRAARERSLSEISNHIGASYDVDSVLRTTAQEIGKALGDTEVTVQLRLTSMDE